MVSGYYYGIQYKSTSVYNNMSVPLVKVCLRRVPFGFYDPQHAAKHQSLQKCRYKYQIRHKITLKRYEINRLNHNYRCTYTCTCTLVEK